MKHLGINLAKEMRDFYNENYKMLMKLKETLEDRKSHNVHGSVESVL
jgi:hypothetical protein